MDIKYLSGFCKKEWGIVRLSKENTKHLNPIYFGYLDKHKCVIKINKVHSDVINESRLKKFYEISKTIQKLNLKISSPIKNKKKKFISFYNEIPIISYYFIDGENCEKNAKDIKDAFNTLGKVHKELKNIRINKEEIFSPSFFELLNIVKEMKNSFKDKKLIKQISEVIKLSDKFVKEHGDSMRKLTKGIIHGDFTLKHLIKEDRKIIGIIDWDYYNLGYLIHDIDRLFDDSTKGKLFNYEKIKDIFLESYPIKILNKYDLEFLPYAERYRVLYRCLNLCRKISIRYSKEMEEFLNKNIEEAKCKLG